MHECCRLCWGNIPILYLILPSAVNNVPIAVVSLSSLSVALLHAETGRLLQAVR
jgi:hypothetical protein